MSSTLISIFIESLVAILLVVMIGYCFLLNRRLKRLRADEFALRTVVGELIQATGTAERAIASLKGSVNDSEQLLSARLRQAERFSSDLDFKIEAGERILKRLAAISDATSTMRRAHPQTASTSVDTDDIFADTARNKGRAA